MIERKKNLKSRKNVISKENAKNKPSMAEKSKLNNQVLAIIIFAVAVLFACLVFIKGENVWLFLHNFVWGLFGVIAFFWPVLLLYIAINTAMAQPKEKTSVKIMLSVIVIFLTCTSLYIFGSNPDFERVNYFQNLAELYKEGTQNTGAGLFSGILGIPFVYLFGGVGAKIIIILSLFVSVMLLTGTSLTTLYGFMKKIFIFVLNSIKKCFCKDEFDEALDKNCPKNHTELPEHPVKSNLILNNIEGNTEKKASNSKKENLFENSAEQAAEAFIQKNKKKKKESLEFEASEVKLTLDKMEEGTYNYPPATLLEPTKEQNQADIRHELQTNGQMLVDTLNSFSVQTKIIDISRGPAVTRYELQPAAGVKISKITNLADDIALNLAALGVRIEAPIPGKAAVGIEIPNKIVNIVKMRELINSDEFVNSQSKLTVILGKDIAGNVTVADLAKMPHLLIAGSTGSGKSVCINSFIISLLYKASPEEVRLLMVDPKVVELGIYNGIPHLLVPVVTDPRKAAGALNWAVTEMLKRYNIFAENNVRDLTAYNKMVQSKIKSGKLDENDEEKLEMMPQIVIIIDELADLMMAAPNEVEDAICRLAQMARAAGMHLVIATQRPSVDVITGTIKANIPSRIALSVSSQIDSRTILDSSGAEKLLGRGDMLFSPIGASKPMRVQGCFLTDKEIENVLSFIKNNGENEYDQKVIEEIEKNAVLEPTKDEKSDDKEQDPMLEEAIRCIMEVGQASTSLLQRRLRLGYARAGRLIDEMERMGIVGPHEGSKPRQILIRNYQFGEKSNLDK
ncbi:MAG: DNA translocase FtsK 4TM domain-containing protein [Acutalibacteraceae bacterium]